MLDCPCVCVKERLRFHEAHSCASAQIFVIEGSSRAHDDSESSFALQEGQEGLWQVCFKTQDSLAVSMELRCISLNVVRCRRCIRKGDQLETLSKLYNTQWLELFLVNPAVHSNPADLRPGMLINVGVLYRSTRLQPLPILAKYLHTTPSAIRRLNPDIGADDEMIGEIYYPSLVQGACLLDGKSITG